jgi:putative flippase GtrA
LISELITRARVHRQELIRFLKFCVVGTIGTVIDFGLLNLLYNVLGMHQALANTISVSVATVSNYTWSRFWVYPETRHQNGAKKFVQFAIVSLIALGLNTGILWGTDRWFLGESGWLGGLVGPVAVWAGLEHSVLSSNAAKVIATGIVLFWNFFANRMWTFKDVDQADTQDTRSNAGRSERA